tara:strand:- start:12201 stop:12725 length:525 start_codon:yes stop_codon:yes gene_type:complete
MRKLTKQQERLLREISLAAHENRIKVSELKSWLRPLGYDAQTTNEAVQVLFERGLVCKWSDTGIDPICHDDIVGLNHPDTEVREAVLDKELTLELIAELQASVDSAEDEWGVKYYKDLQRHVLFSWCSIPAMRKAANDAGLDTIMLAAEWDRLAEIKRIELHEACGITQSAEVS